MVRAPPTNTSQSYLPPPPSQTPSSQALQRLLYLHHNDIRQKTFQLFKEPLFYRQPDLSVPEQRSLTNKRVQRLHQVGLLKKTVSNPDPAEGSRRYDALIDALALLDHSIEIKLGVNFGLFCSSVFRLGSPIQAQQWLPRIESGQIIGCFALTELGHGSNVRGIQTRAEFTSSSPGFLLHTPHESAQKYWIGAAAQSAHMAVVFAQLYIHGNHHGVHAFLVPLRDESGKTYPGIQIADCGGKAGLNGVDNGRIWFTQVKLPLSALLSGMSQVSATGEYSSKIKSPDARFGAMLAALTGGRIGIAYNAIMTAFVGLVIAIKYSTSRLAFGPNPGVSHVPLLYYSSQRRRLMIPLAGAFVYVFCARDLREDWYESIESRSTISKKIHTVSAGYKALFSWFMQDTLQAAREACGGQGYKSENHIAIVKADRDVMLTFEGANSVLLQQVSKGLLAELAIASKNNGKFSDKSSLAVLNNAPKRTGSSKKLDRSFFEAVFWKRERELVKQLGLQYAAAMKRHGQAFHAWNDCLNIAERAAVAHMHRYIFEQHQRHLVDMRREDSALGIAMEICGKLWGAEIVINDPDFLRLGCLSRSQATDVVNQIDDLCYEVARYSPSLIEALALPEEVLAPIAGDWMKHNSRAML